MNLVEQLNSLSNAQLSALMNELQKKHGSGEQLASDSDNRRKTTRNVLVAYYVPEGISGDDAEAQCHSIDSVPEPVLQSYCASRLTPQQTPTRFVALNHFPTLPNGKVSIAELPVPGQPVRDATRHTENDSELVGTLVNILADLLGMDDVRASDNFFEIGGDSITAMQFVSKAREAGFQLDVEAISQGGSIADMADACVQISTKNADKVQTSESDNDSSERNGSDKGASDRQAQSQFAASGLSDNELDDFLDSFD